MFQLQHYDIMYEVECMALPSQGSINVGRNPFQSSISQAYRGLQCWHQYSTNRTLVDLLWKMEICPFQSSDFPVVTAERESSSYVR